MAVSAIVVADDEQRFIEAAQIKAYFAGVGDMILAGALVFSLLVFAVAEWPPAWIPGTALLLLYLVTLMRLYLVRQYRVAPQERNVGQWVWTQWLGSTLSGLVWGCSSVLLLPYLPTDMQLFLLTVISVVAASAISESISLIAPPRAFLLATIAPPNLWLLTVGDRLHTILALMLLVFTVLMLRLGTKRGQVFIEQQQLHYRNEFLAQELARQRDVAEEAHQSKTRFLAAASHDLRQPMHALAILLELLRPEVQLSHKGSSILSRAQQAADAMNGLLDALLDISKIDAGVIWPSRRAFAVGELLDEIAREFQPIAEKKGLRLAVVSSSAVVDTDPVLLGQLLRNLVANAIRYTPAGRVLLGCRRQQGRLAIQVLDTGIGIPSEHHDAIFSEFFQIRDTQLERHEGLGLGLAIVSRVARMLEHPLAVHSAPGRGSCFTVRVPLAVGAVAPLVAASPAVPAAAAADLSGRLVVMIDDDEDIRSVMRSLLRAWGCEAIVAASAVDALQQLEGDNRVVDAMLCDMGLGAAGNGIEAIHLLRQHCGALTPALLVTGDTSGQTIQAAESAGLTMLHKPVKAATLHAALCAAIASGASV